jgi:hypothetical protein
MMDLSDLLECEHRGWRSLCDGSGAQFYRDIMTSDGIMVLANGLALTRREVEESLSDAPPWADYEIEEARLVPTRSGVAILVYRGTAHRGEGGPTFTAMMSSVYVDTESGPRLALYQQTPVPA